MALVSEISSEAREAQRSVSDPAVSAWVSANAGSGKTHVLANRVLRLLLSGVPPEQILCLTYTKTAAAEMRTRVGARLGQWAVMPDTELFDLLSDIEGHPPEDGKLAFARTLFARALETPGGLKINTIHAFAESVLHRFPLEAGVPFGFSVIEDDVRASLVQAARDRVLAEPDPGVAEAVDRLFANVSDAVITGAVDAALGKGVVLRRLLADRQRIITALASQLEVDLEISREALIEDAVSQLAIPPGEYAAVLAELEQLEIKGLANKFANAIAEPAPQRRLMAAYLTGAKLPPANGNVTKALVGAAPDLADRIAKDTEIAATLAHDLAACDALVRSQDLLLVTGAILDDFDRRKRALSLVDFDDLIARLVALLESGMAADWVAYRLDAGIGHVLVDESQDTNPEQWRIVAKLVEEFFAGEGAIEAPRTVFAVGDQKQSIYSFQGAEPRLFSRTGKVLAKRADLAERGFRNRELKTSFRSAQSVLDAVDHVFRDPEAHRGLEAEPKATSHTAERRNAAGLVEVWPLTARSEPPALLDEYATVPDSAATGSAEARHAAVIAGKIAGWVSSRRKLAGRDAPVTPGDILVLVQTRSPLFHALIRALSRAEIPNTGADKFALADHVAVKDLLALTDFLVTPGDDLALAITLRSPLIGISEDQLATIAMHREGKPLWQALRERAPGNPALEAAVMQLESWRARADLDRPYDFFARLVFAEDGLKRFHARLGPEADDALSEFLALALEQERNDQPDLRGLAHAIRLSGRLISRELGEAHGAVRVMTVHGAKGLEAPIVILADATRGAGGGGNSQNVIARSDRDDPARDQFIWLPPKGPNPMIESIRLREVQAEEEEYRRRLYVGMTRAEDELYIAGIAPKHLSALDATWYGLVSKGLEGKADIIETVDGATLRFPGDAPEPGIAADKPEAVPGPVATPLPVPVLGTRPATRHPSDGDHEPPRHTPAAEDADLARRRGIAVHALLESLPSTAPDARPALALELVTRHLPDRPDLHDDLIGSASDLVARSDLAHLFAPDTRAEVPFVLSAVEGSTPVRIEGRIDRLVASEDGVTIVDFKSDALPPPDAASVPPAYLRQMGLYRLAMGKIFAPQPVRAAILWTSNGVMMPLDDALLSRAAKSFTLNAQDPVTAG